MRPLSTLTSFPHQSLKPILPSHCPAYHLSSTAFPGLHEPPPHSCFSISYCSLPIALPPSPHSQEMVQRYLLAPLSLSFCLHTCSLILSPSLHALPNASLFPSASLPRMLPSPLTLAYGYTLFLFPLLSFTAVSAPALLLYFNFSLSRDTLSHPIY